MGKTIRFTENSLIAIKKGLNEIMAGSDDIVSHNDVSPVKLYHGTTIDALIAILKTNRVCAGEGKQHGETHGMNWFSLVNDGSFNRGACFSIEVPGDEFNTIFHKMNNVHVITKDSCLDASNYNIKVEYLCGHPREGLVNLYSILTKRGERWPVEWARDNLFYKWCEESGNEDLYMQVNDYDFGIIMANVWGEDAVREEGFIKESAINEVAPEVDEYTICGEEQDGENVAGGNYFHAVTESKIPQQFIDNAIKLRPDKFHNWVVIDLVDIARMPRYFEKREFAREYYKWLYKGRENSPVMIDLDKVSPLAESINFSDNGLSINDENILTKYNLKDLVLSKNGNYVTLNKIVAKELGRGNGGRFMDELTRLADKNGWILSLTPDASFGASSVGRLKKFYKRYGFVSNKGRNTDFNTRETMIRKPLTENLAKEVESSEVDLSSFKKKDSLPPGIWKDEETLDSKVRLKLLDIADDFWEFVNLTWVEPNGIIITGSICNFNWSKFSDIDLHLIVDFNEIDSKTEFVREYLNAKKNEWNNEHEDLKIMGFPVELYVQDIDENPEAGGIYDLEENAWVRRPNPHTIKNIGLEKFNIKDKAASIMTIIDDMYKALSNTDDGYEIDKIGEDAGYLWDKVKNLRKSSLDKHGESGAGNIVYKVLRRTGYLDKLWKMRTKVYDRSNSITESMKKYLTVLKEEVAMDGSSEENPYEKRWKAEREALKSFVANYGKLMQSKEDNKNGKLYKVYFDETMSNLIGYNYCICVQWNEQEMKPGSTVYIRALDKFTPFIRRNLQFDTRGHDNQRGTADDVGTSNQPRYGV